MTKHVIKALLLLCLVYAQPSFALAKLGHQLVCQLAFEHLPESKQQRIKQLLAFIPAKEQRRINRYNHTKESDEITFAKACTWADAIKKQDSYQQYNAWHYMNLPRSNTNVIANSCDKNCLPQAILYHQNKLQHLDVSWQKTQALLFLGHWLGDIHQPLHVSYASDLGGNKIKLAKQKQCTNLHWYWDSCILAQSQRTYVQWLSLLAAQWHKKSTPAYQPAQVWLWADQSYQLVRKNSFQYCQLDSAGEASNKRCVQPRKTVVLTDNYQQVHLPIMEQQLLLAAKRLQKVLEASL
ncbi:S1/P1 nuclease [Colwellia sp. D2M02]|uniref:S1/P1 nuclease n=1 Tax=Colwellia asteriadis TaxID=517723 RepID=A0ABP3WKV7_9GAMM|nr:S1/P1 nuclease [Colwellia sp. D2M02]MBU2893274.1 S1/P1 nuclease [Colwellia sp. D2M02]